MPAKQKPNKSETMNDLIKLTDKANPKPEDLQRLRSRLDENDYLVRINEVSEQAFARVIKSMTSSEFVIEVFKRQIESKRISLDYESENVMVKMLINHVVLCHIRLNAFEAFHAHKIRESISVAYGVYLDKMLSSYQKRFQKACESLAKVKKLLSEAELRDQQAKNKRSQSTLTSANLYKALST